jgi:anti-sigma regulatory factor (Ser/Thr protein kinase)
MPAKGELAALDAEGGRGIVLMKAFMDEVTYNARGNEVTLVKRRR